MDSGELNKIAGGVIGALLVFMLLGFFSRLIYFGPEHHEEEDPLLAFAVEVADTGEAEAEEEIVDFAALLAEADPADGESEFNKCRACHSLEEGNNGVGPYLYDVVGRDIAGVEGFDYSEALAGIDGIWDLQNLFEFIHDPSEFAPGTKMTFAGLPDNQAKVNLIAFLNEQAPDPTPLVAPEPVGAQLDEEETETGTEVATEADVPVIEQPKVDSTDSDVKEAPLQREEEAEAAAGAAKEELADDEDIDNTATFDEQITVDEEVPGVEPPAGPVESLAGEQEEGVAPEALPGSDAPAGPEAVVDEEVETETRVLQDTTSGATEITEEDRPDPVPDTAAPEEPPAPEPGGEEVEAEEQPAPADEEAPGEGQAGAGQDAADGGAGFAHLLTAADIDAGEQAFRKCQACHSLEEGQNRVGPYLHGVVGRDIAGVGGYSYSDALANKEGVWDLPTLDAFLADPMNWAPGTKMAFPGVDDPQERVNLIAFLNQASDAPVDLGAGAGQ